MVTGHILHRLARSLLGIKAEHGVGVSEPNPNHRVSSPWMAQNESKQPHGGEQSTQN